MNNGEKVKQSVKYIISVVIVDFIIWINQSIWKLLLFDLNVLIPSVSSEWFSDSTILRIHIVIDPTIDWLLKDPGSCITRLYKSLCIEDEF